VECVFHKHVHHEVVVLKYLMNENDYCKRSLAKELRETLVQ
jgi:hypothetical protein